MTIDEQESKQQGKTEHKSEGKSAGERKERLEGKQAVDQSNKQQENSTVSTGKRLWQYGMLNYYGTHISCYCSKR
jgi:hypothetical protein